MTVARPCIHEVRGGEAKCNGGGYDGCACGPYTVADYRAMEEASWGRTVGTTQYRPATPKDIGAARVTNADTDAVFLSTGTGSAERQFIVRSAEGLLEIEESGEARSALIDDLRSLHEMKALLDARIVIDPAPAPTQPHIFATEGFA